MPRTRQSILQRLGFLLFLLPLGCARFDPVTNSTLVGSGLGATTGAIIGSHSGNSGTGALVGAAAGALGGALVGDANQARAERDAAYAYARSQQYSQGGAITNYDVITMSQNGLSADVIINAIHTRGGRFDTSPQSLIHLKSSGVTDSVIAAMQTSSSVPPTQFVSPPAPPSVFVVEPSPPPIIFGRIGPRFHRRYPCRPPRRKGTSISFHGHF